MKKTSTPNYVNLPSLALVIRCLFTGYLLTIGLGFFIAGGQVLLTHGMADGKMGLSVDDVVYSYYGNRNNSLLQAKLKGSMKDKAPPQVRTRLIKWAQNDAPEEQWETEIAPLFRHNCSQCHGVMPGLPDFNHYLDAKKVSGVNKGASVNALTRVSHIHIFSIGFIFFFMGIIFSLAVGIPRCIKIVCICLPFAALILDVLSWWLTKFHPNFAWLTIISGFSYCFVFMFMWCTSLYQMWISPRKKTYTSNEWQD